MTWDGYNDVHSPRNQTVVKIETFIELNWRVLLLGAWLIYCFVAPFISSTPEWDGYHEPESAYLGSDCP